MRPIKRSKRSGGASYGLAVRLILAFAILMLAGCTGVPTRWAPGIDRKPLYPEDHAHLRHFVKMSDPEASGYIMKDVLFDEGQGDRRWTRARPTLRFRLPTTKGLKFTMRFATDPSAMEQTGPVTIKFYIENHLLGETKVDTPGEQSFEKAVPPEWLATNRDILATAEIENLYKTPEDEAGRGVYLIEAGFKQ